MFELFDRRRQRRLRDEQALGGATVVQFLAEDGEVPKLPQRDVRARGRSFRDIAFSAVIFRRSRPWTQSRCKCE
jgi:hypothetical protein